MSMLKTKVYASNINNLSDARYFAAWGVDYIGFPIEEGITIDQINEIINWVEGPVYIGEFNKINNDDQLSSIISKLEIDKIRVNPFYQNSFQNNIPAIHSYLLGQVDNKSEEFILIVDQQLTEISQTIKEELKTLCKNKKVWLDMPFQPSELEEILNEIGPYGLVVKGGEEERPGVKSFDDLDEIFEILEA